MNDMRKFQIEGGDDNNNNTEAQASEAKFSLQKKKKACCGSSKFLSPVSGNTNSDNLDGSNSNNMVDRDSSVEQRISNLESIIRDVLATNQQQQETVRILQHEVKLLKRTTGSTTEEYDPIVSQPQPQPQQQLIHSMSGEKGLRGKRRKRLQLKENEYPCFRYKLKDPKNVITLFEDPKTDLEKLLKEDPARNPAKVIVQLDLYKQDDNKLVVNKVEINFDEIIQRLTTRLGMSVIKGLRYKNDTCILLTAKKKKKMFNEKFDLLVKKKSDEVKKKRKKISIK